MKRYTVRKELRTPVHCQFYCFSDAGLISGIVRDLSASGWRVTVDRPVPVNLQTHVSIDLHDGHDCHPLFIDPPLCAGLMGVRPGGKSRESMKRPARA